MSILPGDPVGVRANLGGVTQCVVGAECLLVDIEYAQVQASICLAFFSSRSDLSRSGKGDWCFPGA